MTLTVSLTEDQICERVRDFLLAATPGDPVEVVQGQANRVPEVKADNFMVFWPTFRARLATNIDTWSGNNPSNIDREQHTRIDFQVDVHGPRGGDIAQAVSTLWRDEYGCTFMAATGLALQPFYSEDPRQMPFINEGGQYENRWVVMLVMQGNVTVSTAQQFADTLTVQLVEVDTEFPPEPPQ